MHSLIGSHFNYEFARQRREVLAGAAHRDRLTRKARRDQHLLHGTVTAGASIIQLTSVVVAVTSEPEHASARVA